MAPFVDAGQNLQRRIYVFSLPLKNWATLPRGPGTNVVHTYPEAPCWGIASFFCLGMLLKQELCWSFCDGSEVINMATLCKALVEARTCMDLLACAFMAPASNGLDWSRKRALQPSVVEQPTYPKAPSSIMVNTQCLLCSSLLVVTCFLLRNFNTLPKQGTTATQLGPKVMMW